VNPSAEALQRRFGPAIRRVAQSCGATIVAIDPARNREILGWLKTDPEQAYDYLVDVTAVEYRDRELPLEVVYELFSLGRRVGLRVKVLLDKAAPLELDSVVPLWAGANWLEREVYDMFGVRFRGHPDLRRILMWETYAEGYPLRKDFPLRGRFSRAEQVRQALTAQPEAHYSMEELGIVDAYHELPPDMRERLARGERGPVPEPLDRRRGAKRTVELALATSGVDPQGARVGMPIGVAGVDAPGEEPPGLGGEHLLINIGPQHPATHGVLRLVVELDGEVVVRVIPHIGYLHSGFEKLGEYRHYNQIIPLTDRMDYLAPMSNNVCLAMAAEKLLGLEITERCTVLRVIACEISRIISHLVWAGTTGIDIGAFTPFLWMFQEREKFYNLQEAWTGARLTTTLTRVGGLMADIPDGFTDGLLATCQSTRKVLDEVDRALTRNGIWCGRLQGIGVLTAEEAINYSLSGPMLRASGVDYDVRKDRPYLGYETYDFDVPVGEHGDVYDRYLVRMEEMRQSIRILEQAVRRLPDGPINVDDHRVILPPKHAAMNDMESMIHHFKQVMEGVKTPVGEAYFSLEGPKGELGYYFVSDGTAKPVRWRVRPPAFINLAAIEKMAVGHLLSDLIAINAGVDVVMGEIDR
jgi:NADH-quinone oxidoreductase subunit D